MQIHLIDGGGCSGEVKRGLVLCTYSLRETHMLTGPVNECRDMCKVRSSSIYHNWTSQYNVEMVVLKKLKI